MSLTTFRQTLVTQFGAAAGLTAVAFTSGKPDPAFRVSPDRALGFIYPMSTNEVGNRVNEEELRLIVEVYQRFTVDPTLESPTDPTVLEGYRDSLMASVKANETGQGPWFQRISSCVFDMDRLMITAVVYAREANPSLL